MRGRADGVVAGWRQASPAARLLIANQFGLCVGFYMVLPFLAGHLRDLGFAAALVGTVIGLRTLCQQGLYLVGGAAADRLDLRGLIMFGCGLRVVAFGLFAVTTSAPGLIAATMLVGVAGAVFSPAVQTYLVHESPGRRAETFALNNVVANTGTLLGPVLGAALLTVDFRLVSAVACAIFAALTVAQALVLPPVRRPAPGAGMWRSWMTMLANRRFLAFTLAGATYFALFNQLYLALPVEAQRVTGHAAAVSAVFAVSTIVGIAFGVRLTAWCRRRFSPARSMALGLCLLAGGFLPLAVSAPFVPTAGGPLAPGAAAVAVLPVLLGTVVFSAGVAITSPFMLELIPVVGSERLAGTYYGYFYLVSALLAAAVSAATGSLLDLGTAGTRWLPFGFLALIGAAGAAGITVVRRRYLDTGSPAARPCPANG